MKKPPSKKQVRDKLNREIEAYLDNGGQVHHVLHGETGLTDGRYDERAMAFQKQSQERTPVTDAVRAIEERREARRKARRPAPAPRASRQPRKKVIYDDFGEPLRVVWEDS